MPAFIARSSSSFPRVVLGVALAIGLGQPALAQMPPGVVTSPADQAGTPPAVETPPAPPGDEQSPREALRAFFDATRSGRWQDASHYLSVPGGLEGRAAQLAERLKGIIDAGAWIDIEAISGEAGGARDDGLPAELEVVGEVRIDGRRDALRMVRVAAQDAGVYWAFSPSTVANIDSWYESLPNRWIREAIVGVGADSLLRPGPFELLWWQWIAIPLLLAIAWFAGRLLSWAARLALHRMTARRPGGPGSRLAHAIGPPATLLGALIVFTIGAAMLDLTDPAERFIGRFIAGGVVVALFWGLWRSVDVITGAVLQSPRASQSASTRSLLTVGANLVRAGIVLCGILALLGTLGYPVATVLAGLGIGGLALAFGAQKTIENLFGSIAIAVDQPFRVGDFVRVDDFVGTVEDIGLRSTRFRTLDRTVVSIPNGKLSDQRLESFQVRDRMRLATTIGVTYETTADQMREILQGLERVLREHPRIWPDAVVVRFKEFGASSLDIELMAWFAVPTWGDFQVCREEVLLGFMGVVEAAGSSFAFPTRTVHLVQDGGDRAGHGKPA